MKHKAAYFFLFPAILFLSVFAFLPMIQIFYFSLLDYNVFGENSFAGLSNYIRLFNDSNFWWTLLNSLIFISVTPLLMIISLSLALMVRQTSGLSKVFRTAYFVPVITPIVIAGIIWRWIFAEDTGLLNYLLTSISIPAVSWLTEYPTNLFSIMFVTIWRGMGYYMVIFLAGLAVVSKELEEASRLDGANKFQQIWHIIIPQLKPTILFIFVVSSTAAIKVFTELYIMIPGAPIDNKTLVVFLYREAFERFDFGYGSAVGVVLFLITLGFSYTNIRLLERGT